MRWATRSAPWVLLCALACSAVACSREEHAARASDKSLATVTAEQLIAKVRASKGKATLVNAWASWCDSCRHEIPMLQGLADRFADRGVRVLLVSVDEPADRAQAEAFLTENAVRLTSYLAARPLGAFKEGMNPRWPGMLPASFLFDGTGKLRYFWGGEAFENEVVPVVEGLLAGKAIDGESQFDLSQGATSPR